MPREDNGTAPSNSYLYHVKGAGPDKGGNRRKEGWGTSIVLI